MSCTFLNFQNECTVFFYISWTCWISVECQCHDAMHHVPNVRCDVLLLPLTWQGCLPVIMSQSHVRTQRLTNKASTYLHACNCSTLSCFFFKIVKFVFVLDTHLIANSHPNISIRCRLEHKKAQCLVIKFHHDSIIFICLHKLVQ